MKIGAQLYSLRDYCKTTDDFAETLKKVADIGYKTVQVSGTCGYDPAWLAEELKKNGLECGLTHYPIDKVKADPVKAAADHKIFGCKYIGLGALPNGGENTLDDVAKFIAEMKPITKAITENGGYYMYHNHAFEFESKGDTTIMNMLADGFAPDEMGFTLDVHWVKAGGQDPIEWLNKLKGRTPCVHFKDLVHDENGKTKFAVVGEGELDFDKIIATCIDNGVEYAFVEQDDCYGENPFDCLKRSFDFLTAKGL